MIRVFVNAVEYIRNNYNYPFCCGKTIEYVNIKEWIILAKEEQHVTITIK